MRRFLATYRSLIWALIPLYIVGNLFAPLSLLLYLILLSIWAYKGKDHVLIIALVVSLVLGDSRQETLLFVKNLRIVGVIFIGIRSIWDLFRKKYAFNSLFWLCVPFLTVAFAGVMRSPNIAISFSKTVSYGLLLFLALHYFPYHFARRNGQLVMDIIYLSMSFLLIGFVLILIFPEGVFLAGRYRGALGNPNGLGVYCMLVFAYTMVVRSIFLQYRQQLNFALGLILLSILLCQSRTALGSVLIFTGLHWFYNGTKARSRSLWWVFLPTVLFTLSTLGINEIVEMIGLAEYLRVESLTTGTGRFLAWTISWQHIQQNFLIGKGFAFDQLLFQSMREYFISTEHQGGVHNSYLSFLMNNGIIGLAFILIFYGGLLSRIRCRAFAVPYFIMIFLSTNFESWLTGSLNYATIHLLLTLNLLIYYPQWSQFAKLIPRAAPKPRRRIERLGGREGLMPQAP